MHKFFENCLTPSKYSHILGKILSHKHIEIQNRKIKSLLKKILTQIDKSSKLF